MGRKVYDIPDDIAGLEAILGEGQRLDPRLVRAQPKARSRLKCLSRTSLPEICWSWLLATMEVQQLLEQLGVETINGWEFFENVLLPIFTQGTTESVALHGLKHCIRA